MFGPGGDDTIAMTDAVNVEPGPAAKLEIAATSDGKTARGKAIIRLLPGWVRVGDMAERCTVIPPLSLIMAGC